MLRKKKNHKGESERSPENSENKGLLLKKIVVSSTCEFVLTFLVDLWTCKICKSRLEAETESYIRTH